MSTNQENIEAKLAAYVDGELSGADREEIERHLTANPQHRKLIIELSQTRTMLQGLPRAKAPADVLDSLQAQLERSALLGSPEQLNGDDSYKIGFWTQFRAVAAILVLTCGLAAVVYYVLPRGEPRIEMAGGPSSDKNNPVTVEETAKSLPGTLPEPADLRTTRGEAMSKNGLTDGIAKSKEIADTLTSAAGMSPGGATGFKLEAKSDQVAVITPELHRQLMANGVNDAATYVVFDTPDTTLANSTVSQYLNDNRLTWEQVPLLAIAQTNHNLKKPDYSQLLTSPAKVAEEIEQHVLATQAPADASQKDLSPQAIASQSIQIPAQIVQQQAMPANTANLIVARNLSQKQVSELNGLLSVQRAGMVSNYRAQRKAQPQVNSQAMQTPPGASGAQSLPPAIVADATTQASPQRIKPGDALTLVIPDSGMGEVTVTAEVDSAGLLSGVSTLGGTMVNGLTLDELNAAIVSRYRETNQAMNNAGSVVPHATRITAAAVEVDARHDGLALEKQLIVAPFGTAGELTDVVIIVRDAAANSVIPTTPVQTGPGQPIAPVEGTPAASTPPGTAPVKPNPPSPVEETPAIEKSAPASSARVTAAPASAAPATTQPTTQP